MKFGAKLDFSEILVFLSFFLKYIFFIRRKDFTASREVFGSNIRDGGERPSERSAVMCQQKIYPAPV